MFPKQKTSTEGPKPEPLTSSPQVAELLVPACISGIKPVPMNTQDLAALSGRSSST